MTAIATLSVYLLLLMLDFVGNRRGFLDASPRFGFLALAVLAVLMVAADVALSRLLGALGGLP